VAKDEGDDLITLNVFEELIKFDEGFKKVKGDDDKIYDDYCYRIDDNSDCEPTDNPLEFVEISYGTYSLEGLTSDADLLARVQTGKGPTYSPSSPDYINIDSVFGGTSPSNIVQNDATGANNLTKAKAAKIRYLVTGDPDIRDEYLEWDPDIEDYVDDFNDDASYIKIYPYTVSAIRRGLRSGLGEDITKVQIGIALIVLYSLLIFGRSHPFRSRVALAISGIISVAFAYIEAIGFGTYCGLTVSGITDVLPFVLLGIGVDDMYVLVLSMEQVDVKKGIKERTDHMMRYAGVSITITSLTSLFSFAVSSSTSLPALSNFCGFASLGIFFDYFNQITFFVACIVLDEKRMNRNCGDCCGLCLCAPASAICCKGKCFADEKGEEKESFARKFIREKYAPFLMKTPVKIAVVIIFAVLLSVMAWGTSLLELDFNREWFIMPGDPVVDTIDIRDEYFDAGG